MFLLSGAWLALEKVEAAKKGRQKTGGLVSQNNKVQHREAEAECGPCDQCRASSTLKPLRCQGYTFILVVVLR